MWPRKRIDISWSDILFGVWRTFFASQRDRTILNIENLWSGPEHTFVCLSVRSGLDQFFAALNLPHGGEVLLSAITIPDIVQIIGHHGLVPVPVDLDPQSLTPPAEAWEKAVTPKTKAVVVAHLFGGRPDMEPLMQIARRHKLYVIEDCAQAFSGMDYQGHPDADASMFSFGLIKANTALGGAILRIRDSVLMDQLRAAQTHMPLQSRWRYLKRLMQAGCFKILSCRPICSLLVRTCRVFGCEYDSRINHASKGFPGASLFAQLRQQPSTLLLDMLHRRLRNINCRHVDLQRIKGKCLATLLQETVPCPGALIVPHTYWAFPVIVDEPQLLMERLARAGFDATQGHSLCVVPPPQERLQQKAFIAERILAKTVFLPLYPELPLQEIHRMVSVVRKLDS